MPAQRRVVKGSSDEYRRTTAAPTPRPQSGPQPPAPSYKSKMPTGLKLSWPNNVVLKPRNSTPKPSPTPTPSTSSWQWPSGSRDPLPDTSRWMSPKSPAKASKPAQTQKPAWDSDSRWNPPAKLAAQMTPAKSRPRRSTARPVNYDESWMDAAF